MKNVNENSLTKGEVIAILENVVYEMTMEENPKFNDEWNMLICTNKNKDGSYRIIVHEFINKRNCIEYSSANRYEHTCFILANEKSTWKDLCITVSNMADLLIDNL